MPYDYVKSPEAIYKDSFSIIEKEATLNHLNDLQKKIAIRVIHSCGLIEAGERVQFHSDFITSSLRSIRDGMPIFVDSEMTRFGIIQSRLKSQNNVICTLNDKKVEGLAQSLKTTRSATAVELWQPLTKSLVVIGNAPTALFHLLERIEREGEYPAAIIGLPVGFVGATESKEALMDTNIPWLSIKGRMGGSAMAAAAVNALSGLDG